MSNSSGSTSSTARKNKEKGSKKGTPSSRGISVVSSAIANNNIAESAQDEEEVESEELSDENSSGEGSDKFINESESVKKAMKEELDSKSKGGRRKINIEFIENKSRRHVTFSKRKAGLIKKAYELSTLTGTQVLLLVASETGNVYTFATPKLQPLITKPDGKQLIQSCLNPEVGDIQGNQATIHPPSQRPTGTMFTTTTPAPEKKDGPSINLKDNTSKFVTGNINSNMSEMSNYGYHTGLMTNPHMQSYAPYQMPYSLPRGFQYPSFVQAYGNPSANPMPTQTSFSYQMYQGANPSPNVQNHQYSTSLENTQKDPL